MLCPEVIAPATNLALTANANANANKDANALVSAEVQDNPNIYPSAQVIATLFTLQPQSHAVDRVRTRSWSNIKSGN
ncbi:Putrescine-binding periplasmic protein precursor [compost metagenome]